MCATLFRRCLFRAVALVIGLTAVVLFAGCGGNAVQVGAASFDQDTRAVTVQLTGVGDHWKHVVLLVTYPDGRQEPMAVGKLREGTTTWVGTNMSAGTYFFTPYWIPLEGQDPASISVDEVVSQGTAGSRVPFSTD